jgi:type I restriction enzyme R subunit
MNMRNFDYLKDIEPLKDLYGFCSAAEDSQQTNHDICALNCRRALEWIVKTIYTLKHIDVDKRTSLLELTNGEPFTQFVGDDDRMMMAVHYVRKIGNKAAHDGGVKKTESFFSLLNIYNVVGGILLKLRVLQKLAPFDKALIPSKPMLAVVPQTHVPHTPESFVHSVKEEDVAAPQSLDGIVEYDEAETRRLFIDLLLEEAGWEVVEREGAIVPNKACREIEVHGMVTEKGVGYADYVLFGANGKPLAVVEAKRTTKSPEAGRKQAILYADCLEQQYGVRPVIYYTNGFRTFVIDGLGYPARQLQGFHTQDDLLVLLQRRGRAAITDLKINDEITNREYQKRAIRAICEHFNTMHRRGLLVMATGTGKTRVSISLCDVLMRNGWAKNILFLADRTALVKQAHKNFTKLLPSATTCVLNETREPDMNARIMFSTYQTMINYIDTEQKQLSVGRFDLIVIDEVHRSIFGKYTTILSYFDALMVGLTATPREDNDKSTYDLFQMEGGEPNFAYELKEAVDDGYLVNYHVLARTTNILKQGIKYDELSDDEKKQMDGVWKYEKAKLDIPEEEDFHRNIEKNEIFSYIFNEDTISKVLIDLMDNGLKINGGDTIGKTIVFAYNHDHAVLIVEKFKKLYPELGDDFCQLIDNYVNYAQSIIDTFEVRGKMPQIAVSVDMLDTGIDVPDILNLVFFKPVHSKIKFWQMIGRGTRLSEGIFDDGTDKQCFYIFDWCGNFEFFGRNPKGYEPLSSISLTERLFGLRVDLAIALQHQQFQDDEMAKGIHDEIKETLQKQVKGLNDYHISVREHWELVDKFRKADNWVYVSNTDGIELKETIAPLLVKGTTNMGATKFDILLVDIELSMVDDNVSGEKAKIMVERIGQKLQEKASIPQIMEKMELIKEISVHSFWETATLSKLENVRKELRDLVQFITGTASQRFTIDIKDTVEELGSPAGVTLTASYKQKVLEFLTDNKDLPVLKKIMRLEQLEQSDIRQLEEICWKELGSKEDYEKYIARNNMICGDSVGAFIRSQIGVDRHHAMEEFSKFLSDVNLNSIQEEYVKTIITYVCQNGDITLENLVNTEPFSEFEWIDTFGQHFVAIRNFVNKIHQVIA